MTSCRRDGHHAKVRREMKVVAVGPRTMPLAGTDDDCPPCEGIQMSGVLVALFSPGAPTLSLGPGARVSAGL